MDAAPRRLRGDDDPRGRDGADDTGVPGMSAVPLWIRDDEAAPAARSHRRRRPARQRPLVVSVLCGLAGLGLGVTIALGVTSESAGSLGAPGGVATAIGRMTGLLAAYAMVIVVLLVARVPPLEPAIGQDRLVAWHRKLGPWPLYLLVAHGGSSRSATRAPRTTACCIR